MKYVMGIDNGGTVTKAVIFDINGKEIYVKSNNTTVITPKPGYTERDMEILWQTNCKCIKECIEESKIDSKNIIGISLCGHGKGLYLWGKDETPAYNGIISTDTRAWQFAEKFKNHKSFDKIYNKICQQILPAHPVSILAWFKENDLKTYEKIKWVFSVKDYIRFRLTNQAFSEITDISGSGLINIKDICLDKELLAFFGIEEVFDMIPPLKNSYDICGTITKEVAEKTGLQEGTIVAGGMFDIDACAIAMNVTSPKEMCMIAGTWSINEFIAKNPVLNGPILLNSLFAIPKYYLIEECSPTSAGNLEWFINNIMENEKFEPEKNIYDYINKEIDKISENECEVYFLPFLYGCNTHPLGKGSFIGLTTFHNKIHMARAVFEGVAFSHKMHIEKLLQVRDKPEKIQMAGGATNSSVWVQLFADILNIPVQTVNTKEIGSLGCAMSAAIASGLYKNYDEACEKMGSYGDIIYPNQSKVKTFEQKYEKYKKITNALNTVWDSFQV